MADIEERPDDAINEMNQEMSMSRGVREEVKVDLSKTSNVFVYDQGGNKIRFGDVYKCQKTIVVLTRHALDFIAKEYVEDLALIPLEYLQAADVRVVVIVPSPFKYIKGFKEATGFQYSVYCDPDKELFNAMGCKDTVGIGKLQESKHVKSGAIMGVLRSTWRAVKEEARVAKGDMRQQGASLVLGPGDVVHFAHIDQNSVDHVDINDLLTAAGVQNVSFPKDPRIIEI